MGMGVGSGRGRVCMLWAGVVRAWGVGLGVGCGAVAGGVGPRRTAAVVP